MGDARDVSVGGQPLTPTEEFNEAGARLYRWPNGQPALYIKEMPDAPPAPCIICGLADGDLFDSETFPGLPSGYELFVCFNGPECCPKCGREYKAEASVRVYCREQPNAAAKGGV